MMFASTIGALVNGIAMDYFGRRLTTVVLGLGKV
jgi:hypothetical protein